MGKVIVITGAGGGLGKALAEQLPRPGDRLVLLGRTLAKVEAVARALGDVAVPIACDVTSPASIGEAFARIADLHDGIDVLINNAGIFQPFLLAEASEEQVLASLLTNLAGPILCTRAAIPLLRRGGHIINVSSESVRVPIPHLLVYQATKAGLETFSENLALELKDHGIRVTVVRAGQMTGEAPTGVDDPEAAMRLYRAALDRGIDIGSRGTTRYASTVPLFRAVIDSTPDLHVGLVSFQGWPADA